jgi:hypothetical protein
LSLFDELHNSRYGSEHSFSEGNDMVKVFIWRIQKPGLGKKGNIGHAAMQVDYDDDTGCYSGYISWWPTGKGNELGGSPAFRVRTFQQDCSDEGHKPDRIFTFEDIFDEPKILDMWDQWRTDLQYQMMFRNCSTLIRRMLCNSGMAQYVQFVNFCSYDVITVPEDIEFYCGLLERL